MTLEQRRRLHAARELVEVALAEGCLHALAVAIQLEHPTVDEPKRIGDPRTLNHARAVLRFAAALRGALGAYRAAVDAALDAPPRDDLPF